MKAAIIGYGEQGRSSLEYWQKKGYEITVCDQKPQIEVPPGVSTQVGVTYLHDLSDFDLIVRSPSVHPSVLYDALQDHQEAKEKITSNTNEFFNVCPAPIIGVTGTKGKGTTSTLIAKILEKSGKKVHLGGNIGTPPLDLLKQAISPDDIVVLELANFQLIDMKSSPKIAVCLMITEEHLDWHNNFFEYIDSKRQIFKHQDHDNIAIYNANNVYSTEIASSSRAHNKISYDVPAEDKAPENTEGVYLDGHHIKFGEHKVCSTKDIKLPGRHNIENVCAAIAATWDLIGHNKHAVKKVLKNFTGLPHRLEKVAEINDVTFIDDSFGTNPATAIVALRSFRQPKIIIVGGSEKGISYQPLVDEIVKQNVKHVVAIGETGPAILELLKTAPGGNIITHTSLNATKTMDEIISSATEKATNGDVILLSTASASFDMFKDYKDRGDQFKVAVKRLAQQ